MALTTFVAGNVLTAAQLNDSFAAVGGLRAVVPTSVTVTGGGSSGSVGTNGKVTFGTAASVSVNGCFSSTFTNYRLVCDFDSSTDTNVELRLRVSGVDADGANTYIWQNSGVNDATYTASRVTTTLFRFGSGQSTSTNAVSADFYRPFVADQTAYFSLNQYASSSARMFMNCGTHNQATSYDGFTLLSTAGTITGSITVYGYFG